MYMYNTTQFALPCRWLYSRREVYSKAFQASYYALRNRTLMKEQCGISI